MVLEAPCRIGVVINTVSNAEKIERVVARQSHEVRIAYAGLDDAIQSARQMEDEDIEVIVSRRGTAVLLREKLQIPVLSFPRDTLAIIESLQKAAAAGGTIFFTEFREPLKRLDVAEKLLGVRIIQGVYRDAASLQEQVRRGAKLGCRVAVGGGLTVTFAERLGLTGIELELSEDELEASIENAVAVARSNRARKADSRRYQAVIDSVSEGVVAFDHHGAVTTINRTAGRLLSIDDGQAIGTPLAKHFNATSALSVLKTKSPLPEHIERVGKEQFLFSHSPVLMGDDVVGGVSVMRDFSNVMKAENEVRRSLAKGLVANYQFHHLIHRSPVMQAILEKAARFAATTSTVCITGESGTGKELIAQGIHNASPRRKQPFVSINCAALPEQLLESELFGYEEGAFTGSKKGGKPGLLELAHNGTVFLDEIAETPLHVQVRLLRVLQEREVMRVGSDRRIPIDVRIITATNRDLIAEVQASRFREDLFFRIDVLRLHMPALRERPEDIPVIIDNFLLDHARKFGFEPFVIPLQAMKRLMAYGWPGNVRQLRNFVERLVLVCESAFDERLFSALYEELVRYSDKTKMLEEKEEIAVGSPSETPEAYQIRAALEKVRYHRGKAASLLGISRTSLWKKMKDLGLT